MNESRFQRIPELPFTRVGEQVLVVVAKTREVHLLNESAARIWELLEESETLDSLVESLGEEYDVDAETAEAQIEAVVAEMRNKGLVQAIPIDR